MPIAGVNIAHIVVNEHGPIFAELIELLVDSLGQLGHRVEVTTNQVIADRFNILVGATVALPAKNFFAIQSYGVQYVVFQVEALDDSVGFAPHYRAYVEFLAKSRQVWDYSPTNLPFLTRAGCQDVRHIPIGHSARLERIVPAAEKDIDVLFCGAVSNRRQQVLKALVARGVQVQALFGKYGPARDQEIARAKVVLNIHQFDTPHLEELRLAYLLNNRCFVVSETCDRDPYGGGVVFCDYAELVDRCVFFAGQGMEPERDLIAATGYAALKSISTMESIRSALAGLGFD